MSAPPLGSGTAAAEAERAHSGIDTTQLMGAGSKASHWPEKRLFRLYRAQQYTRDIDHLGLPRRHAVDPVGEHGHAERAADRDGTGAGSDGLLDPLHVDPLADPLLHPHPGA